MRRTVAPPVAGRTALTALSDSRQRGGLRSRRLVVVTTVFAEDFDRCYRAVCARDARFDGWFVTAVLTTHVYCRPSCPARTPFRGNVRFFSTAAAAHHAGFRACKRCRPDATPGSPEWNARADVVARVVRLVADGVVDREGVGGVARRIGYSERQLHRQLVAEVGVGLLALARAQRAQTARVLVETTDLPFAQVAFAAGFGSIRQFNDTVREVFAMTPGEMRHRRRAANVSAPGAVVVRLPYREPFAARELFEFLALRAVDGVEDASADHYRRSLRLPHGTGVVTLRPASGHVVCELRLDDVRDLATAVSRSRALLDLDADPIAVDEQLGADRVLGPWVRKTPGMRVPGTVDGAELAMRVVLGQQVSVAGARTLAARLTAEHGEALSGARDTDRVTHIFPSAARIAALDPATLPMPRTRARTLVRLAGALADGTITVDAGAHRGELRARLLELPGVGEWTADLVVMRGTGDPDVFLTTDLGVRRSLARLGHEIDPASWRPWRSYALAYVWRMQ